MQVTRVVAPHLDWFTWIVMFSTFSQKTKQQNLPVQAYSSYKQKWLVFPRQTNYKLLIDCSSFSQQFWLAECVSSLTQTFTTNPQMKKKTLETLCSKQIKQKLILLGWEFLQRFFQVERRQDAGFVQQALGEHLLQLCCQFTIELWISTVGWLTAGWQGLRRAHRAWVARITRIAALTCTVTHTFIVRAKLAVEPGLLPSRPGHLSFLLTINPLQFLQAFFSTDLHWFGAQRRAGAALGCWSLLSGNVRRKLFAFLFLWLHTYLSARVGTPPPPRRACCLEFSKCLLRHWRW